MSRLDGSVSVCGVITRAGVSVKRTRTHLVNWFIGFPLKRTHTSVVLATIVFHTFLQARIVAYHQAFGISSIPTF